MLEIIVFGIFGCITGAAVGLLPGLTNSIAMILLYPFLIHVDPLATVSFYVCMITMTQYHGGLGSTIFGIPTEVTCLPSVREGFAATVNGKTSSALSAAAIASFSGSVISVVLCLIIFYIGNSYFVLYNYSLQLIMLTLVLFVTVYSTNNNILISLSLLLLGHILGKVGTDSLTGEQFATFGNPYLIGGIPIVTVMVFLYSFPMIINLKLPSSLPKLVSLTYEFILPAFTVIRSSIIGFICGFIPQLGAVVGSNLSYSIEKVIRGKNYETTGDIKCLAASDAAHNSAIVASLIPLFVFAVPIVPSEGILYEITRSRGLNYNMEWLLNNYWWLGCMFAFANFVGVITTWPLAKYAVNYISDNISNFKLIIIVALIAIVLQMGYTESSLTYYIVCSMVFLPVGYVLRRYDLTPLLVGFMLAEQFDNVARVAYNLYLKG